LKDSVKMRSGVKGLVMEEALRAYFLRAGYFVLRSVALRYQGFDVTDVDIWLYERPSSVSRHRIIVDAKNRKTPQAIERIFWTKGLQLTLGVEQSIVATMDKRSAVLDFGREHDVLVLDGAFVARLMSNMSSEAGSRLTEEEFRQAIDAYALARGASGWRARLEMAKSVVLNGLSYSGINFWLEEARYFAEQAITVQGHADTAMRALYLTVSLIAIAIDYVLKDLAFVDPKERLATIGDGLRYGAEGKAGTRRILDVATGLVERYAAGGRAAATRIRQELFSELGSLQTDILAEYFGRSAAPQSLFSIAREFEAAAYARQFIAPALLGPEALGLLGVLADYWAIERTRLLGKASLPAEAESESKHSTAAGRPEDQANAREPEDPPG
jgi:hypothetical protein